MSEGNGGGAGGAGRLRTFGWDACKLSDAYTRRELGEIMTALAEDPANRNPEHAAGRSIHIYTNAARKKMDAVAWAIHYRLREGQP